MKFSGKILIFIISEVTKTGFHSLSLTRGWVKLTPPSPFPSPLINVTVITSSNDLILLITMLKCSVAPHSYVLTVFFF